MIQGLWDRLLEAIIDVKLRDADADSYKYEPMKVLLDWWEAIKKENHIKHYNNQQKYLSPFVLSVDGILVLSRPAHPN